MSSIYAGARYLPPSGLIEAHTGAWADIGRPGAFWTAAQRVALVEASRAALSCPLCERRRTSLSPFVVDGAHVSDVALPAPAIELAHRLTTDPGRLTRRWFERLIADGLSVEAYVEAASVVAAAVIVDTLHQSLGLEPLTLPSPIAGPPSGVVNTTVRHEGAWVPMEPRESEAPTETHMPTVPNIRRALSLVPGARSLFFRAFGPHYRLTGLELAISRPEIEFVAARVSAMNQCFY